MKNCVIVFVWNCFSW